MKRLVILITVLISILASPSARAQQPKIKVIADQDSAGPGGTNLLSLLMLLRDPQIDLLGITTVSGDQWVEPATVFAVWATEQANRPDVPVVKGAEQPLLNTLREQNLREAHYGSYAGWHGSFNPDAPKPSETWMPPGGYPKLKPRPGRAADFIIDTIRANPGQVILYCGGPLTNIALALRMDPGIVPLTKAIYIMGGSSTGMPSFNWWWDPEAAAIVIRELWKEIVVSPFEVGEQAWSSEQLMRRVVAAGGPLAKHVKEVYLDTQPLPGTTTWSMMWDELLVAYIIDPLVITKSEEMYLDVDVEHGPQYGITLMWKPSAKLPDFFLAYSGPNAPDKEKWASHLAPPAHLHPATVQLQADVKKFEDIFVQMMSK